MLFKKLIPAFIWALFILGLCALPGKVIPELTFLDWLKPDKIVHLFLFGVLSFLLIKAFREQPAAFLVNRQSATIAIFISSCYGILIEVLQEYVFIGRTGDKYDAMADALGAFIGLWFLSYRNRREAAKRKV